MVTRRMILKGIGVTLGLPWLESARGEEHTNPAKRLAVIHISNGVHPDWWSKGDGDLMELGPCLKPMEPYKNHMNIYHGLFNKASQGRGVHPGQAGNILTGIGHEKGQILRNGISFDQIIAREVGQHTPLSSLVLSCETPTTGHHESGYSMAYSGHISWNQETAPVPLEIYPAHAFDTLFENRGGKRLQSILDRVAAHASNLKFKISAQDTQRIDEYFTGVRELEKRIEHRRVQEEKAKARSLEKGERLVTMKRPDNGLPENCQEHMRLMLDILALAFQTDRTRVISLILSRDGSALIYPFLGLNGHHHGYSHEGKNEPYKKITIFKHEQLAYLIEKLSSMKEGENSVLDNSCILFLSSMFEGWSHNSSYLPVLTVGGLGGTLKTGRTLDYSKAGDENRKLCGLYLGLMKRMGMNTKHFGDADQELQRL